MSARLALQLGDGGRSAELPAQGRLILGASERADFVVEGQGVDEVHCAIGRLKGGGWALKDLGSKYGTFVNGQKISSVRLQEGDTILLGSKRMRVFDPSAPAELVEEASQSEPAPEPRPNIHIKGYCVERLLGRGSMGSVYLATQESLDRKVALKVLAPRLEADLDFVGRFQAEARAAAALNHPNVVTVYDVGEDGGHHYLSMEFMGRGCLESRLAQLGPMNWRDVLGVMRDAASGLVYAEGRRIVHRDIKPANLMQNELGQTKIADLGLAAQVEHEAFQGEAGRLFGTPHFLAPELIRGGAADARSDLYSLGATAYRLLTGHTPFEGSTSKDILRAALRDEPPPLAEHAAGIPDSVRALISRLLAKDPNERYPSAAVLLQALAEILQESAAGAAPATGPRSRVGLVLAGAAVIALTAIGGKALFSGADEPSRSSRAPGRGARGSEVAAVPQPSLAPTPATHETSGPPGGGPSDAEKLLEAEARLAFMELDDRELGDEERIAALRQLAGEFDGTDAATRARAEAERLEGVLRSAAQAADRQTAKVTSVLAALRESAAMDGPQPRPGSSLRKMRAVPGQAGLESDPAFVAGRAALEKEILAAGLGFARKAWQRAEELEGQGEFERMRESLSALVSIVDFPEFPPGQTPFEVDEMLALAAKARERLGGIDTLRTSFAEQQRSEDLRAIAAELRADGVFEAELRSLELDAAARRLEGLGARLATPEAGAAIAALAEDLRGAEAVLAALGRACAQGEWRRKRVVFPEASGRSYAEADGGDERGLIVAGEHVPWGAWGAATEALQNLFNGRLGREWTAAENDGIAALLRITATVEAIGFAEEMLAPSPGALFTDDEASELLAVYDTAASWPSTPEERARLDAERRAAGTLTSALRGTSDGAWSAAETELERIFREHRFTLLVLLLSDGSAPK